jgi:hypothetical protein
VTTLTTARAPMPSTPPGPGFHYEAKPDPGKDWSVAEEGKTCRYRGSGDEHAHGAPAVLALERGVRRRIKWNYCAEHSYGRWLEDGVVMTWILVPDTPEAT